MTNRTKHLPLVSLAALALAIVTLTAVRSAPRADSPNDILIIANNSISASSISADELKAIFLKKKGSFAGSKVVPINAKSGSALRKAFQSRVVEMDENLEANYWEQQKIKTGLTPPVEFAGTVKAVFSVKGSIGYCLRSEYREGVVKVLLVL
jgi:hypothetical protein